MGEHEDVRHRLQVIHERLERYLSEGSILEQLQQALSADSVREQLAEARSAVAELGEIAVRLRTMPVHEMIEALYGERRLREYRAREKIIRQIIQAKRDAGADRGAVFFEEVWPRALKALLLFDRLAAAAPELPTEVVDEIRLWRDEFNRKGSVTDLENSANWIVPELEVHAALLREQVERLERERDQARARLEAMMQIPENQHRIFRNSAVALWYSYCEVKMERDEALEHLEFARQKIEKLQSEN